MRDRSSGWRIGDGVTGIQDDSRQLRPGEVFVAVPGTHDDGRSYVREAIRRGAVAIVSESPLEGAPVPVCVVPDARTALAELASAFYGDPWRGCHLVAVTGTAGKSTAVEWVLHLLRGGGEEARAVGSLHREGVPEGAPGLTTPSPVELHRRLRGFRDAGVRTVVLEVTSHAIRQSRVHGITFEAGVLTSLGRDHLDYHPTLQDYWNTKRELFTALPGKGRAFLPASGIDPGFAQGLPAPVTRFGEGGDVAVIQEGRIEDDGAYSARLLTPDGGAPFRMFLPGPGMARSAASAAAYALWRGMEAGDIARLLGELREIPGRLESFVVRGIKIVIDYGHNPPGIATAMAAAREMAGGGRLTVVLGAPGHRDRGKLPEMGRLVAEAESVIVTSESPEGESPEELAELLAQGVREAGSSPRLVMDREEAVREALRGALPGDVVLLLGRGRERFQDFGQVVLLGSDRELVERAERSLRPF